MREHWPIDYDAFFRLLGRETFEKFYKLLELDREAPESLFGLTDLQQLAVYIYTTPLDYYLQLNSCLRDWQPEPAPTLPHKIFVFAVALQSALRKLPVYSGYVYRGIQHPLLVASRASQYQIGQRIVWNAFTSTSRSLERAYTGNTLFRILSKNGRSLAYVTADDDTEVLFSAFTPFDIVDVIIVSEHDMIIDLEESGA